MITNAKIITTNPFPFFRTVPFKNFYSLYKLFFPPSKSFYFLRGKAHKGQQGRTCLNPISKEYIHIYIKKLLISLKTLIYFLSFFFFFINIKGIYQGRGAIA